MDKNTNKFRKLSYQFYSNNNVVQVARELLGKIIVSNIDGLLTVARIVETEAYVAFTDKASHSYNGRRTNRNEHMYGDAGIAYVYTCYGIHQLFNVVTHKKEVPDAVLIRAAEPISGTDIMLLRSGKNSVDFTLTRGPGNLSKALGIKKSNSGIDLGGDQLFIAEDEFYLPQEMIGVSKRIGIDSAGYDALLPYRFYIKGNKFVSGRPVY